MALHKLLVDDFDDLNYSLLAVHCEMEDFRLAYFLNQSLATRLSRTKEDLDFLTSLATFSVFFVLPNVALLIFGGLLHKGAQL